MFEAENIRLWRGHRVVDRGGGKIGELEAVYVDTRTDEPAFATVRVGLPGRRRLVFVPLRGTVVGPGWVKVAYDKSLVKAAPSIDTDGELLAAQEDAVFAHYELSWDPAPTGERRLARR